MILLSQNNNSEEKISGEKIYCEGHRIEKPKITLMKDGHHGFSTFVKHGSAIVIKKFRWKEDKR